MPASPAPEPAGAASRPLATVVASFGGVGVAATLFYFVLANAFTALAGLSATPASVAAYLMAAIFSYYGHKHWTFASARAHAVAVPRFLVSTALGLALATLLPVVGEQLALPALAGFAATCVLVPVVNFFLLGIWVFDADLGGSVAAQGRGIGRQRLVGAGLVLGVASSAYALSVWRWGICPDTSWLITVAERIGAGDRLYADIMEVNPPFSVWLYLPPVRLAELVSVAPEHMVRLYVLALCLAATSATGWMLARSRMLKPATASGVAIALFAVAVLLSGNSFSERDHIGAVLALPLFALAAWRAGPGTGDRPRTIDWLIAGAGAGILAVVKPYYAVVVVAVACLLVLKRRDIRLLFLPEYLLSAAITAAYLALSYALYPVFFEKFLPLLQETYMAFRWPIGVLAMTAVSWLALPLAYAFRRKLLDESGLPDYLMIGAAVAWLPYFLQGKGWPYHAYPATLFGSAALVIVLALLFERLPRGQRTGHMVILASSILLAHMRFMPTERPPEALVEAGLQEGRNQTVGMLAGGIEKGHPYTRMIGGRWIEPFCSDWLAVFAMRRIVALSTTGETDAIGHFKDMAARYYVAKRLRLTENPPQLLIVDRTDAVVREMISNFGFDELLARFRRIAASDGIELFRLKDDVTVQPASPAAG